MSQSRSSWIRTTHLEVLLLHGLSPTVMVLVVIVEVHVRQAEGAFCSKDPHAVLTGTAVDEVHLLSSQIIAPGSGSPIREEVGAGRTLLELEKDGTGVLDLSVTDGVPRRSVHPLHVHAGNVMNIVHIMDGVYQQGARGSVPCNVVVAVGLGIGL